MFWRSGKPTTGRCLACGDDGIASFDRIRYRRHDGGVFLYAFDLGWIREK
jgi:hypothetical protein